jgi:hypothetical protein
MFKMTQVEKSKFKIDTNKGDLFLESEQFSVWLEECRYVHGTLCMVVKVPKGNTVRFLDSVIVTTDVNGNNKKEWPILSSVPEEANEMTGGDMPEMQHSLLAYRPFVAPGRPYVFSIFTSPLLDSTMLLTLPRFLVNGSAVIMPTIKMEPMLTVPICRDAV